MKITRKAAASQRKSGYYWVEWSYGSSTQRDRWLIAYFDERTESWYIQGDTRPYFDATFLGVRECRITRTWVLGDLPLSWMIVILGVAGIEVGSWAIRVINEIIAATK